MLAGCQKSYMYVQPVGQSFRNESEMDSYHFFVKVVSAPPICCWRTKGNNMLEKIDFEKIKCIFELLERILEENMAYLKQKTIRQIK